MPKRRKKMSKAEAGRIGGRTTKKRHGIEHYRQAGKKGFMVTVARHWAGDKWSYIRYLHECGWLTEVDRGSSRRGRTGRTGSSRSRSRSCPASSMGEEEDFPHGRVRRRPVGTRPRRRRALRDDQGHDSAPRNARSAAGRRGAIRGARGKEKQASIRAECRMPRGGEPEPDYRPGRQRPGRTDTWIPPERRRSVAKADLWYHAASLTDGPPGRPGLDRGASPRGPGRSSSSRVHPARWHAAARPRTGGGRSWSMTINPTPGPASRPGRRSRECEQTSPGDDPDASHR